MTKTNLDVDELIKQACSLAKTAEGTANSMDTAPTSVSQLHQNPGETYGYSNGAYNERNTRTLKENVPNNVESVGPVSGEFGTPPHDELYRTGENTPSYNTSFSDPASTSVSELRLGKSASAWLGKVGSWNYEANAYLDAVETEFAMLKSAGYENYDTGEYLVDDTDFSKYAEDDAIALLEGDTYNKMAEAAALNVLHEGVVCGMKVAEEMEEMAEQLPDEDESAEEMDGEGAMSDMLGARGAEEDDYEDEGEDEDNYDDVNDDDVLASILEQAAKGNTDALDQLSPEQIEELISLLEESQSDEDEDAGEDAMDYDDEEDDDPDNDYIDEEELQESEEPLDEEEMYDEEEAPIKTSASLVPGTPEYNNYVMSTIREMINRG